VLLEEEIKGRTDRIVINITEVFTIIIVIIVVVVFVEKLYDGVPFRSLVRKL
jgi:hypothetical protein